MSDGPLDPTEPAGDAPVEATDDTGKAPTAARTDEIDLSVEIQRSYLDYAMSVIVAGRCRTCGTG